MVKNQRPKVFSQTSVYHWEVCPILVILFKLETRFESVLKNYENSLHACVLTASVLTTFLYCLQHVSKVWSLMKVFSICFLFSQLASLQDKCESTALEKHTRSKIFDGQSFSVYIDQENVPWPSVDMIVETANKDANGKLLVEQLELQYCWNR